MPGDGVSLPTTLSQMGTVAKTQAKGQQNTPQVTPFSEQSREEEELKIQRVRETAEAEKNRVTDSSDEKDKRKRRRLKRNRRKLGSGSEESVAEQDVRRDKTEDEGETRGSLIDLRV